MKLKVDVSDLQTDLRKIGVAIIIASVIAALFENQIPLWAVLAGATIGVLVWLGGLIRREE